MRYIIILSLLFCSTFSFAQENSSFVKKLPDQRRTVNDFGGFLSGSEKDTLETALRSYLKKTTNAIIVVTLESLTDPKTEKEYTIEEAARLYFNTWGVGDKIKNNGIMLMVSRNPRRVRIQVGSGLENILTNDLCQEIVGNNLVPELKQGLFFAGIKEAVAAIEQRLDDPTPTDQQNSTASYLKPTIIKSESVNKPYKAPSLVICLSIIGGIIVICVLFIKYGRPLSGGWYTSDGYIPRDHDGNIFQNSSYSSGVGWSSGGSSSGGGSSYGGGSSSGGGASGSW